MTKPINTSYAAEIAHIIGQDLTIARKRRSWTQRMLAERSFVSLATVKRMESGRAIGMHAFISIILTLGLEENLLQSTNPNHDQYGLLLSERQTGDQKRIRIKKESYVIDTNF